MTNYEKARKLRDNQQTYKDIGLRLGISTSQAYWLLNCKKRTLSKPLKQPWNIDNWRERRRQREQGNKKG